MIKGISVLELSELLESGEVASVVDVRTSSERSRGYIPGSVHVCLDDIFDSREILEALPRPICFYCKGGVRSMSASSKVLEMLIGDSPVYNLEGGIVSWKNSGFDVAL